MKSRSKIDTSKKVLIAMSGGVDSSVSALLMQSAGFDCEAIMLRLFDANETVADRGAGGGLAFTGVAPENLAGAGADTRDDSIFASNIPVIPTDAGAKIVADLLGIPFNILDLRHIFRERVVEPFINSYLDGSTPNPCIQCNRYIKFGALLDYANAHDFDYVATGHYARVDQDLPTGRFLLKKGADSDKDQSYMLYSLTQTQLSRVKFPLGGRLKRDVRKIAESRGFPNAHSRESQDICFIPDGDYAGFIAWSTGKNLEDGPIADVSGAIVGRHKGAVRYTVGQRKGLGLAMPEPMYVFAKSMAENKVFVGHEKLLYSKSLIAENINLISVPRLEGAIRATAKTRYRQSEQPATIEQISDGEIRVEFDAPQRAVTCGQAVVFYDGDTVLGGGTINKS